MPAEYASMADGVASTTVYAPSNAVAVRVAPARDHSVAPRVGLIVQNVGAVDVWLGPPGVTAAGSTRGILLKGGQTPPATFSDSTIGGEVWAVTAAGTTADLTVMEVLGFPM